MDVIWKWMNSQNKKVSDNFKTKNLRMKKKWMYLRYCHQLWAIPLKSIIISYDNQADFNQVVRTNLRRSVQKSVALWSNATPGLYVF